MTRLWVDRQRDVTNVVVVLDDDERPLPVAMALTTRHGQPVITAIGLPEDHRPGPGPAPGLLAKPSRLHPEAIPSEDTTPTRLVGHVPADAATRPRHAHNRATTMGVQDESPADAHERSGRATG